MADEMGPRTALDERRLAVVLEHVAAENERDVERALRTFHHARYEIMPTGQVFDGVDAVREMLTEQWKALPPVTYEAVAVFFGETGLMVETRTVGAHPGGTPIDMISVNMFGFEADRLVVERCFFDQVTAGAQLGYPPPGG